MQIGDRVQIVARTHPWHLSTGTIVEVSSAEVRRAMGLDFVIELDRGDYSGHGVFVGREEIKEVTADASER